FFSEIFKIKRATILFFCIHPFKASNLSCIKIKPLKNILMKTLKTFFFTLALVALMGCNNTNRDRTDDIDNSDLNLDDNSDDVIMNDPYNSNSNTGSVNDDRTAMYRQLNMTPEQIQRFESENPNFSDSI